MSRRFIICHFKHSGVVAERIASIMDVESFQLDCHEFPDQESIVRAPDLDAQIAFIVCSLERPDEKIVPLLLAADALRRRGARRVALVAPYLAYMRQDRVFRPGDPVSQRVIAGVLDRAFDDLLTVEPHLHRISALSEIFETTSTTSISAASAIAAWLNGDTSPPLVVGPDRESMMWVEAISNESGLPGVIGTKIRRGDRDVSIEFPSIPPGVDRAFIVDDIASSGATVIAAAGALRAAGIEKVGAIVVHALFDGGTLDRLTRAQIDPIASTDSVVHPTNAISIARPIADMIRATLVL